MKARVLVVEDNPANLRLMEYLLTAFGYAVLTAGDGAEGVELAMREMPDVILMDLQMPTIDGFEAASRLKGDPVLAGIPIVAVTAFAMVGDRDRILARGFDGYIAKPIAPETFVGEVEAFIPSHLHSSRLPACRDAPLAGSPAARADERT
jgi:two-component system cell cycle response regulator